MILGLFISMLLIWPAYQQIRDDSRLIVPLNPKAVTYCELSDCSVIEPLGLEVVYPTKTREGAYGTEVFVQLVNRGRLTGEREFWAELRTKDGKFVEAMRGFVTLTDQGPQVINFFFTGKEAEFRGLVMKLGY